MPMQPPVPAVRTSRLSVAPGAVLRRGVVEIASTLTILTPTTSAAVDPPPQPLMYTTPRHRWVLCTSSDRGGGQLGQQRGGRVDRRLAGVVPADVGEALGPRLPQRRRVLLAPR